MACTTSVVAALGDPVLPSDAPEQVVDGGVMGPQPVPGQPPGQGGHRQPPAASAVRRPVAQSG